MSKQTSLKPPTINISKLKKPTAPVNVNNILIKVGEKDNPGTSQGKKQPNISLNVGVKESDKEQLTQQKTAQSRGSATEHIDQRQASSSLSFSSNFIGLKNQLENEDDDAQYNETQLGTEIAGKLTDMHEYRYQKKYPFEKAQYHQCIPNPQKEDEFITVQLINRTLVNDINIDDDEAQVNNGKLKCRKYDLALPTTPQEDLKKQGIASLLKVEHSDEEAVPAETSNIPATRPSRAAGRQFRASKTVDPESILHTGDPLNHPNRLREGIDSITGVKVEEFAKLQLNEDKNNINDNEIAIIAFWGLNEKNIYCCHRFFTVPNPQKRMVSDENDIKLYQVLYRGENNEQFFFFKQETGVDESEDSDEILEEENGPYIHMGILNLEGKSGHIQLSINNIQPRKQIISQDNCSEIFKIQRSILQDFIVELNDTPLCEQQQMPNPTILTIDKKRLLVFTAFLKQKQTSQETNPMAAASGGFEYEDNPHRHNHYPTIFFYGIEQKQVMWEIEGAEAFVSFRGLTKDGDKKKVEREIYYMTNEVWQHESQQQYNERTKVDFKSRHDDYPSCVNMIYWEVGSFISEDLAAKGASPTPITKKSYTMHIPGIDRNLSITDRYKVIKANMHNVTWEGPERITVVYKGFGAYTFLLQKSKRLEELASWEGTYKGSQISFQLQFTNYGTTLNGNGEDEEHNEFDITGTVESYMESEWSGTFMKDGKPKLLYFDNFTINKEGNITSGEMDDDGEKFTIVGTTKLPSQTLTQQGIRIAKEGYNKLGQMVGATHTEAEEKQEAVDFEFQKVYNNKALETIYYKGKINVSKSFMKGTWGKSKDEVQGKFELKEASDRKASIEFKFKDSEKPDKMNITIDMWRMLGKQDPLDDDSFDDDEIEIWSLEQQLDAAQLIYFIHKKDVVFISDGNLEHTYIQASLTSVPSEQENGAGGYIKSHLILYQVSEEYTKETNGSIQNKLIEPKRLKYVHFLLDHQFLKAQDQSFFWQAMPLHINKIKDGEETIIGSVIYEQPGNRQLSLNLFTAVTADKLDDEEVEYELPIQPVPQTWIVQYPLLAYKNYTPDNREICIIHLAQNDMPQSIINLGEWEFVCFVNHTQMCEKKLFNSEKETNTDIMFLAERDGKLRLMSFKHNPWLGKNEKVKDSHQKLGIVKNKIFLFSGVLNKSKLTDEDSANPRRFTTDKFQQVYLITKKVGQQQNFMFVMQFNDSIYSMSLNHEDVKQICGQKAMVRRHMVRGYNDKIFFAEQSGTLKINMVHMHPTQPRLEQKTICSLATNCLVAFEPDQNNIQDDFNKEDVQQAFYLMDDNLKIYHVSCSDNVKYIVNEIKDFQKRGTLSEIQKLKDTDWSHVHITDKCIAFDGVAYSLKTHLSSKLRLPQSFFGLRRQSTVLRFGSTVNSTNDDNDEPAGSDNWHVQSLMGMPMTTNMIAVGYNNNREFSFVVKPSPGTKRTELVGFRYQYEIKEMLFVTNQHILVMLQSGKTLVFKPNGTIVHQKPDVQKLLDDPCSEVVGSSFVHKTKKYIVLTFDDGQDLAALEFGLNGVADIVGNFDDYRSSMCEKIVKSKHNIQLLANKWGLKVFHTEATLKQIELASKEINRNSDYGRSESSVSSRRKTQAGKMTKLSLRPPSYTKNLPKLISKGASKKTGEASGLTLSPSGVGKLDEDLQEVVKQFQGVINSVKFTNKHHVKIFNRTGQNEGVDGEVIKIGAVCYQQAAHIVKKQTFSVKKKKVDDDENKKTVYFGVYNVENRVKQEHSIDRQLDEESLKPEEKSGFKFKVILFQCETQEEQTDLIYNTSFEIIGKYLVWRHNKERKVWITKLEMTRNSRGNFIMPAAAFNYANAYPITLKNFLEDKEDLDHVIFKQVPPSSHLTIKSIDQENTPMTFHKDLLQIVVRNQAIVYNLDDFLASKAKEINFIEEMDQIVDPQKHINTGFIHMTSTPKDDNKQIQAYIQRKRIFTNEQSTLCYLQEKNIWQQEGRHVRIKENFSGMIYRTFTELDLLELRHINKALNGGVKIHEIDKDTILSTFEGHSIFSIYFDNIQVYEQILNQLQNASFDDDEEFIGTHDKQWLRLLLDILSRPTQDLARKQDKEVDDEKKNMKEKVSKAGKDVLNWFSSKEVPFGEKGFKSILQKCVHFRNARYRDLLMDIAALSKSCTISKFVDSLDDMEILFDNLSPSVIKFFQEGFLETNQCKKVKNADWPIRGINQVVWMEYSSALTEEDTNLKITGGKPGAHKGSGRIYRNVTVKMLKIDWMFHKGHDGKGRNFGDMVRALARAPHESLFSTELVITLVENFWDEYSSKIKTLCLIPFMIYFAACAFYFSYYLNDDQNLELRTFTGEYIGELLTYFTVIVGTFYFLIYEIIQLIMSGFVEYILDFYNIFDVGSILLNGYIIFNDIWKFQEIEKSKLTLMASFAMLFMWVRVFYWYRLFTGTSFYMRLLVDTIYDLRFFLIILITFIMMFANVMLILNGTRESDPDANNLFEVQGVRSSFMMSLINQYLVGLGEFQTDGFSGSNQGAAWLFFVMATFITQVIIFNMLIAVMSDTYDRVTEKRDQATLREKVRILADYVWVVGKVKNMEDRASYIFVAKPKVLGDDEGNEWEGKVSAIRTAQEKSIQIIKDNFKKSVNTLQGNISEAVSKVHNVDEKITGLQTTTTALVNTVNEIRDSNFFSNGRDPAKSGTGSIKGIARRISSLDSTILSPEGKMTLVGNTLTNISGYIPKVPKGLSIGQVDGNTRNE